MGTGLTGDVQEVQVDHTTGPGDACTNGAV